MRSGHRYIDLIIVVCLVLSVTCLLPSAVSSENEEECSITFPSQAAWMWESRDIPGAYGLAKFWPPTSYCGTLPSSELGNGPYSGGLGDPTHWCERLLFYFRTGGPYNFPEHATIDTVQLVFQVHKMVDCFGTVYPTDDIAVCLCTYHGEYDYNYHPQLWEGIGETIAVLPAPTHTEDEGWETRSVGLDPKLINRDGLTSIALRLLNDTSDSEVMTYVSVDDIELIVTYHLSSISPPVASFTYSPQNPVVGQEITFDASSSYDPDGQIVSSNWDFGDGNTTEGQVATYAYSEAGNHTVTLTVTDNDGLQDFTSQIVDARPVPVIFVHGYYADAFGNGSAMWQSMITYLKNNGYDDNDLFAFELEPGPLPANGDITRYAGRLSAEIARVKNLTGAKKVDLVCHSMGGLVARWYTTHNYHNDVRNLIMIGTPNHGSELLLLAPLTMLSPLLGVSAVFGLGPAGKEMQPHSPFLNTLNYGSPDLLTGTDLTNTSIHHEVIAGNQSWWLTAWMLPGENDGVVRVESARLDGVNLQMVPYDHRHEAQGSVSEKVLAILKHATTAVQRSSMLVEDEQGNSSIQEAPMISDKIFSSEQKSYGIPISATSEATFALAWLSGNLDLTLTTPSGITIDPSVAEGNSSISYYQDGNTTIKGYTVQNPESGIWQVNISAVDVPNEGADYTVLTFLETVINLSLNPAKYQYHPGEQIGIVANLTNDGMPLTGASVTAEIQRPDESVDSLALYDDGLHGDGEANDGVYTNAYADTAASGTYGITVSANGTVDSEEFARQAFATLWVEQYPDLTLASSDISFSDDAPIVGGNITIEATIHNIGDANAGNTSVLFYDGAPADGVLIGEEVIDVNASQTGNASTSWNPTVGQHEIHVVISPFNGFLEKDYTNNEASKIIDVMEEATPTPTPTPSTSVNGITREVNGDILPGVSITLDGIGPVVSDQNGQFQIMATATGNYTVMAHKDGFRDRTQIVNIAGLDPEFAVTCNFQGAYGLIPCAPDIWYALDCVNLWLYPPNPDTGLDMWTALDVINAWLYPVQ